MGQLTNLQFLSLNGNPLTGTLPSDLGSLSELQEIDLHDTSFTGTIPEELYEGVANSLNHLDFSKAQLSGTISTRIGLLTRLDWFLVADNQLTGTVPTETGQMLSLNRFNVYGNNLSGSIPDAICVLRGESTLRDLKADCSTIGTGEIPIFCPAGCCTECCNQDTDICLPTSI